ncbi:MAG: FAD:protein FMN transferase [Caldilineaceae bacterium]
MNTDVAAWIWSTQLQAEAQLGAVEDCFAAVEDNNLEPLSTPLELSRLNRRLLRDRYLSHHSYSPFILALTTPEPAAASSTPPCAQRCAPLGDRSFEQMRVETRTASSPVATQNNSAGGGLSSTRIFTLSPCPQTWASTPGGIAKGWTVDQTALRLGAYGPALVDAGGDMRATASINGECCRRAGSVPSDQRSAGFAHTMTPSPPAASASGKLAAQWTHLHHLIDPRTQQPAEICTASPCWPQPPSKLKSPPKSP